MHIAITEKSTSEAEDGEGYRGGTATEEEEEELKT